MDIIKQNFGNCLKNLRKIKNFTQEMLAEEVGINLRQLARIEAGESFVSSETLYNICEKLEIDPWELFNFKLKEQYLMTGTDNVVYLNVIKSGRISQIVSKNSQLDKYEIKEQESDDFDQKMVRISKSLRKEIIVDEIEDGEIFCTKIFKPDGNIEVKCKNNKNLLLQEIKDKIHKIAPDKRKLEFINLAYESLYNKDSLQELKTLIKGIELMQG